MPKTAIQTANTFGRVRYSWYCRPLAIVLALLLLGPFPELPNWSLTPRAAAQTLNPCVSIVGKSKIVQAACAPASLEKNAVEAFLLTHGIPASEAPLLYQYGREDLRSELRAAIFVNLVAIIRKLAATRTVEEQAIYDWFQKLVWEHEKDQYAAAKLDRDLWKNNPCGWKIDPVVAAQYNLNYDPSQFCANNNTVNFSSLYSIAPVVPTKDYFLTAALKDTYGKKLAATPRGTNALGGMLSQAAGAAAVAIFSGLATAATLVSVIGGYLVLAAGAWEAGFVGAQLVGFLCWGVEGATTVAVGAATVAGPLAVVAVAATIGAIAAMQVFEHQKTLSELDSLTTDYNRILANKPNLESFITNPVGMYKIQLTFVENTIPDFPSTEVPLGRRTGDREFVITPEGGPSFSSRTFTYLGWGNTKWTAQPSGGWISAQGLQTDNSTIYNFGVSVYFRDWNDTLYRASRNGLRFFVSKQFPAATDTICAPDSTGKSTGDLSKCAVYVADSLRLLDGDGKKVTVRFTSQPAFTSGTSFTLDKTTPGKINITADGIPVPTISSTSTLPPGFTFSSSEAGKGQISYDGLANEGSYTFSFRAESGGDSVSQTVTALISVPVKIQGPDDYSVYAGQPFRQLVVVGGSPVPVLSCINKSDNLTLTDNGNGTAILAGTAPQGTIIGGSMPTLPLWCELQATNSVMSDTRTIRFSPKAAPLATITSTDTVTWATDRVNEFRVTTSGAITPVTFSIPCGGVFGGGWLNLKDNGDGTAILSGQPPAVTNAFPSYVFMLHASTGDKYACGVPTAPSVENPLYFQTTTAQRFTINVKFMPFLPDPMYEFLTAGQPTFGISTIRFGIDPGVGSVTGYPPPGVQFTGIQGGYNLGGTPELGSGGEYDMLYTSTGKTGDSVSGLFRLFVQEAPQIVSQNSATFRTGGENSFVVTTTGFPKLEIPGLRAPMRITVQGMLPPGVGFSDTNALGIVTGGGILSGKPTASARGSYPLKFTAANGVGSNAVQNFTLVVALPGDANNDGVANCSDVDVVAAAFGFYRGSSRYDSRADVNSDGVTNFADLTEVESQLPAGGACPFSIPFTSLTAAVSGKSKFDLTAAFTLNPLSTGIDPVTQPVSLQVGSYTVTIPQGSFRQLQNGANKGNWVFDGKLGNVSLIVQIAPLGGASGYQLTATASGGDLAPLPSPVPVKIMIGKDSGKTLVNAGN